MTTLPNGDLVGFAPPTGATTTYDLVRWDGTGWSLLATGMNDVVWSLAVMPNGDLVAGGSFATAGGVPAKGVARWNGVVWSALGSGIEDGAGGPGTVVAVTAMANGDIVAAGYFPIAGGNPVGNVASWNGTAWSSLGAGVSNFPEEPVVLCASQLPNGDLVVGGIFDMAGTSPAAGIARWDGSAWSPLGSGVQGLGDPRVRAMTVSATGELVVGGLFANAGGVAGTSCIARWNGSAWASLGGGCDYEVLALSVLPGGDLMAAGSFGTAGAVPASCIARWNGAAWSALSPVITDGQVTALHTLPDGSLVAGGNFTVIGAVPCQHVARWDGSAWTPLGTGVTTNPLAFEQVSAIATLTNGDVVVGGSFLTAGGVPGTMRIARWNGSAWSALGSGVGWPFETTSVECCVRMPNGDLIAGGTFTFAGSGFAPHVARWNGSTWSSVGGGANGDVLALAVAGNGDLIIGGQFDTLFPGPITGANGIARWNGTAWSKFGSGLNDRVYAILVLGNGDIVVGGDFTSAGGVVANRLARWNGTAWSALGTGVDGRVTSLVALPNGDLMATGAFTSAGGQPAAHVARWNGTSWSAVGDGIDALAEAATSLPNGDVVVGGSFLLADGAPSACLARITTTCPAIAAPYGNVCTGPGGPLALAAISLPWAGSTFRTQTTGLGPISFAFVMLGFGQLSPGAFPINPGLLGIVPGPIAGCDLLLSSIDFNAGLLPTGGTATWTLPLATVQADPSLPGVAFYVQVADLDFSADWVSTSTTNGLECTVGAF
ncbi:MAG: hypothetical protein JNL08_08745 [Planctomycetes bacterium]|nr:hypothetical protein [Planctomycetota bacterium]